MGKPLTSITWQEESEKLNSCSRDVSPIMIVTSAHTLFYVCENCSDRCDP